MLHVVYGILSDLVDKPKVLWARGANDQIVSDESLFDLATLGKLCAVPGGAFVEVTLNAGHTLQVDQAEAFNISLANHLRG